MNEGGREGGREREGAGVEREGRIHFYFKELAQVMVHKFETCRADQQVGDPRKGFMLPS